MLFRSIEEFANIGLFCKTIGRSGNRKSSANIGRNFKPCNLTEKQLVSKEINCSSLGPVGAKMKPDGVLMSGISYKLQEGARNSSAPPASGGSETPSLTALDSAEAAIAAASPRAEAAIAAASPRPEAASAAASPGAVAQRARGFQPATVFENRRPASLRLALANPTEAGRSHDAGEKASGRGRLMRADNVSLWWQL